MVRSLQTTRCGEIWRSRAVVWLSALSESTVPAPPALLPESPSSVSTSSSSSGLTSPNQLGAVVDAPQPTESVARQAELATSDSVVPQTRDSDRHSEGVTPETRQAAAEAREEARRAKRLAAAAKEQEEKAFRRVSIANAQVEI